MKLFLILITVCFSFKYANSQSFAINTDGSTAHNSALLDVKSTSKGMLVPRMTKSQKNSIATPANGLMIFQTGPDSAGFYFYLNNQWNWLTDAKKTDSSFWSLKGNYNLNPPPRINSVAVDPLMHSFLGTMEQKDLSFVVGGVELLRLQQQFLGGKVGIANRSPEYSLDLRTTENFAANTSIIGMRIIPDFLYDFNGTDNRDKGLVIGYDATSSLAETILWNYGSNTNSVFRIGMSNYNNSNVRAAFNITGKGIGIYQKKPAYLLDIHGVSNFANQTPGTFKDGIRITYPGQENNMNEKNGLFMGLSTIGTGYSSYIWNYANGVNDYSYLSSIYLGVGDDPDQGTNKPTMQIRNGMVNIGNITPNTAFPSVLNIQTTLAASATKNGLSIMEQLSQNESIYLGTDQFNNLYLKKFGNGNIELDVNGNTALSLRPNGDFIYAPILGTFIKAFFRVDTFRVSGMIDLSGTNSTIKTPGIMLTTGAANGKILSSDNTGNASWVDPQNYWTLNGNDIYSNNTGSVGIGVTNPFHQLDVGGRMRIRSSGGNTAGTWLNNDANSASPAFIGMRNDNLVGFYGSAAPNSGWGFLMNTNNGRVGIGTDNPSEALHVIGNILASGSITQNSDARLKMNIKPIHHSRESLQKINGYTYNWKDRSNTEEQIGLLAQELQKVYPQLVKQNEQGILSVNYNGMVPVLLEAIKEQQLQIVNLQKEQEETKKIITQLQMQIK